MKLKKKRGKIMKNKLLKVLGMTMIVGCMVACGSENVEQKDDVAPVATDVEKTEESADDADEVDYLTYEFETFDGEAVVINENNIVSQEDCEDPFEWEGLPEDAEQIAPGRDCVLFADSTNYYIEDATNKLVITAFKELGDLIEDTDIAVFDNDVYSFEFDSNYFEVYEDEECVTASFYNEEVQTAGSNVIIFKEVENADAMEIAKVFANQYGVDESSIQESSFGKDGATAYLFSVSSTDESESGNKMKAMACAVVNGDNVVAIEVLSHVEPDEGMEMFIDDKIAEVLDTFTLE